MVGYGEIKPEEEYSKSTRQSRDLWNIFKQSFPLKELELNKMEVMIGPDNIPFLCVKIESREHILPALKTFLKKDRWAQ